MQLQTRQLICTEPSLAHTLWWWSLCLSVRFGKHKLKATEQWEAANLPAQFHLLVSICICKYQLAKKKRKTVKHKIGKLHVASSTWLLTCGWGFVFISLFNYKLPAGDYIYWKSGDKAQKCGDTLRAGWMPDEWLDTSWGLGGISCNYFFR